MLSSFEGSFALLRKPQKLEKVEEISEVVTASDEESLWYDRSDTETDDDSSEGKEIVEDTEPQKTTFFGNTNEKFENVSLDYDVVIHPRNCYPVDLWCMLANYIKPEQVKTFASICRGSYFAVSTIGFWSRLYERFVTDSSSLPARLKSDWIESRDGFKCRVIRALFIARENLHNRLAQQTLETARDTRVISQLIGLRCCHMWYEEKATSKSASVFKFYFKFKRNGNLGMLCLCKNNEKSDYLNTNSERDFIVFQLTVSNYIRLQSVSGESLTDISVNLSRNLRFHCIKMTFHAYRRDRKYRKGDGKVIILEPVSEFRLLRWWHPLYPHYDE